MRFPVAYYLFLLYLTIMFKPLLPVVNDAVAHFFAEAKHIAVVHAKYGAHHASVEMASNAADDTCKNQSSNKAEEVFPVHVPITEFKYNTVLQLHQKEFFASLICIFTTNFLGKNYPPPKFVL